MIDYFKGIFIKPKYLWTTVDEWAVIGLILGVCIVLFVLYVIGLLIVDCVKRCKFKKCKKRRNFDICWNHQDCLNCRYYKKESRKEGGKDE